MGAPPRLNVIGLGPSGAILALRAAARGWDVHGFDPAASDQPGTSKQPSTTASELPDWPATYGVFEPEIPRWARNFFSTPVNLQVITAPGRSQTLGFRYCMLDPQPLREATEAAIAIHPSSIQDSAALPGITVDCRGAVVIPGALWQLAVGIVVPFSDANPPELETPTFMDWRAPADSEVGAPPSFCYIQQIKDGWLVEETILATTDKPNGLTDPIFDELRTRLKQRINSTFGGSPEFVRRLHANWSDLREEIVAIPMGTRQSAAKSSSPIFGARAGFIHPATGYSIGTALQEVERFLDDLTPQLPKRRGGAWFVFDATLAQVLRRLGSFLIADADRATLQDFFRCFFALSTRQQLDYLSGRSGVRTMTTMWALRKKTGWRHPFLRPLFRHPVRYIRAALRFS